ncbi:MAG: hypothetical protein MUE70_14970 [Desulfobacterales bacterium]|jgi:hypothetical protein|nr:hypothetical protein [Desulfobacterales bacterium]
MNDDIEGLESKRKDLHEQLAGLGDFRRGTISVNYRKCGKKNCACARPGHPGHGPQYLWNTTIKGKSYAKNLKMGAELQKVIKETETYRVFINLCDEIVQTNEKLCELRPVNEIADANEAERLKKKLQKLFRRKYKKK